MDGADYEYPEGSIVPYFAVLILILACLLL